MQAEKHLTKARTIHLAPVGAQHTGEFTHGGKPTVSTVIAEPKVMLCGLGLPIGPAVKVMVPLTHPSLCKECLAGYPKRMGSIQPMLYP